MKLWPIIVIAAFTFTAISSCKKIDTNENVGIIGKWELKEVFYGYVNGGDFKWHKISKDQSHILIFTQNGHYSMRENINENNHECIGTYNLQANHLEINSNCNTSTENAHVGELTTKTLILDYPGIEGKISYKYSSSR